MSILPNEEYFCPINLMDTTFGDYNPVFLLKSNDTHIFYTSLEIFLFLNNFNLLDNLKQMSFSSKFNGVPEQSFDAIKNTFFCSSLDIDWTNALPLKWEFYNDMIKYSKSTYKTFHYTDIPDYLNIKDNGSRIALLDSFIGFIQHPIQHYFLTKPGFFIDSFILRHKFYFEYFKDDIFYFIKLFEIYFSSRKEIDEYLLKACFSGKEDDRFVSSTLLEYKKNIL
jgi:hypothetical protein